MKIKKYILILSVLFMFAMQACGDSATNSEYQLKAAFLYNFIMFIEWPKEKMPEPNEPIIIGILGKDPFGNAFDPIKDKQAKDRKVVIQRFDQWEVIKKLNQNELQTKLDEIRKCHLLFVCRSEKQMIKEVMSNINGYNILTVGDMDGFLESGGGVINFVVEDDKIRFEINSLSALNAKLEIRSQLLRLAKKVIEESQSKATKNYEYIAKYDN
ncbi:MAG: YfiR family protein [Phycisphaerales bacterium]